MKIIFNIGDTVEKINDKFYYSFFGIKSKIGEQFEIVAVVSYQSKGDEHHLYGIKGDTANNEKAVWGFMEENFKLVSRDWRKRYDTLKNKGYMG